jgi:hypothetical protein
VKDIKVCLVNNNSKDSTYGVLKKIKEDCRNVSIVNIKKFKSENSAVKAGARFMSSQFNLKHLGFVDSMTVNKYKDLSLLIKMIRDNQIDISRYNENILRKKEIKLTLFQSLFSVMDYLAKRNISKEPHGLNRLDEY